MANEALLNYIRAQISAGYNANDIRTALISYGYPLREIDDTIAAATSPRQAQAQPQVQQKRPEEILKAHEIVEKPTAGAATKKEELPIIALFRMWFLSLSMPRSIFNEAKPYASFAGAVMNVSAAAVIGGLIAGAIVLVKYFLNQSLGYAGANIFGIGGLFTKVGTIERLFMTPIEAILVWISITAFLHLFASFIGGDGDFETFSYYTSLAYAPIILFVGFLQILVPPCIVFFSYIAFGVLGIYPTLIATKEVHRLDTIKAIIAIAIPIAIVMVFLLPVLLQFGGLLDTVCFAPASMIQP